MCGTRVSITVSIESSGIVLVFNFFVLCSVFVWKSSFKKSTHVHIWVCVWVCGTVIVTIFGCCTVEHVYECVVKCVSMHVANRIRSTWTSNDLEHLFARCVHVWVFGLFLTRFTWFYNEIILMNYDKRPFYSVPSACRWWNMFKLCAQWVYPQKSFMTSLYFCGIQGLMNSGSFLMLAKMHNIILLFAVNYDLIPRHTQFAVCSCFLSHKMRH